MKKSTGIQLTALALLGAVVVACSGTERLAPPSDDYNGISLNAAGSGGMPPVAGGAGGMPMTGGSEFCDAPALVFAAASVSGGCGTDNNQGCHGANAMRTDFLSGPDRLLAILDAPSSFAEDGCTAKIIDTANPEQSLMLTRLMGQQPPECGNALPTMPPPRALSAAEAECMVSWVTGLSDAPAAPAPDVAVGGGGAPGGPPDPPPVAAGCDRGLEILASSCAAGGANCHGDGSGFGVFGTADQVQALVSSGATSTLGSLCGDPLFNPADPASSLVIQKMRGTECGGAQMPIGPPVSEEDIQCLTDWIGTL